MALLGHILEPMMETVAERAKPTAIRTDLRAIFVSLELSRSRWLITSLSPGNREKMSKHSVQAGDIAGMLARFSELRNKTQARTGESFPIVVIQEAGLDRKSTEHNLDLEFNSLDAQREACG
jgi:transposase